MRYFMIVGLALIQPMASIAQWGSRGCFTPGFQLGVPVYSEPIRPASDWRYIAGDPTTAYLFRNGVQIGGYCNEGYWRDYDPVADSWGPKVYCDRLRVPEHIGKSAKPTVIEQAPTQNFGMDWTPQGPAKITRHDKHGDREITRATAIKEMAAHDIPDDSKKLRLTVIGDTATRKPVMDQWASVEAELKDRVVAWSVPPDHWSLKDTDTGAQVFKANGSPTVYLQAPGGQVLHRQDDGVGAVEAVRKAIKKYDADKDPDLRKPSPVVPILPALTSHPAMLPALLLGGLFLLAFFKGKQ